MSLYIEAVDWLEDIDLTEGFTSWHIKWPIGILGTDIPQESETFDMSMSNKNGKLNFFWRLKVVNREESLDNKKYTLQLHPLTLSVPTPIISLCAFSYEGEDPIFTSAYCSVISGSGAPLSCKTLLKCDVKLTVHCWFDIPNDILKFIETRKEKDLNEDEALAMDWVHNSKNIEAFLSNSETIFKGAIGEDKSFASLSDVTLVMLQKSELSDGRFFCHRNILAARSPVFFTMLMTEWKEGEDRIVEIDDIHEKIMKSVLYHIYTGQFADIDVSDLPAVIYAADKYQLRHLKAWSVAQLFTGEFKDEERIDHLVLAERHQLHQMKAACTAMLSTNVNVLKNLAPSALSTELLGQLIEAVSKRQVETKTIETTTGPDDGD